MKYNETNSRFLLTRRSNWSNKVDNFFAFSSFIYYCSCESSYTVDNRLFSLFSNIHYAFFPCFVPLLCAFGVFLQFPGNKEVSDLTEAKKIKNNANRKSFHTQSSRPTLSDLVTWNWSRWLEVPRPCIRSEDNTNNSYSLTQAVLFPDFPSIFPENNTCMQCFLTLLVFNPTTITSSWSFGCFVTFDASKLFHLEYLMTLSDIYTNFRSGYD